MNKYYCKHCKDKLCDKCVELPWECPEKETCKNCKEELDTVVKKLYLDHQRRK